MDDVVGVVCLGVVFVVSVSFVFVRTRNVAWEQSQSVIRKHWLDDRLAAIKSSPFSSSSSALSPFSSALEDDPALSSKLQASH